MSTLVYADQKLRSSRGKMLAPYRQKREPAEDEEGGGIGEDEGANGGQEEIPRPRKLEQ